MIKIKESKDKRIKLGTWIQRDEPKCSHICENKGIGVIYSLSENKWLASKIRKLCAKEQSGSHLQSFSLLPKTVLFAEQSFSETGTDNCLSCDSQLLLALSENHSPLNTVGFICYFVYVCPC